MYTHMHIHTPQHSHTYEYTCTYACKPHVSTKTVLLTNYTEKFRNMEVREGAGEMAQGRRVLAALAQGLGSVVSFPGNSVVNNHP